MCIVCDMQQLNRLHGEAAQSLIESLAAVTLEQMKLLKEAKAALPEPASALAQRIDSVLSKADAVMAGQQGAQADAMPDGLAQTLQAMFPGAKIIVGTPEQVESAIQSEVEKASGKKPN